MVYLPDRMKKIISLTFVTLAIAAIVTGMTAITTTQIVNADKDFGKAVSEIAKGQSECDSAASAGSWRWKDRGIGGDGCDSDGTGNSGKRFGKDVSNAAKP